MFFVKDQFATVWKVEDKGKYHEVQMSTSRKDKEGNYINSSWGFVRFVASAHEYAPKLERGDRIVIKSGGIQREPYEKDGEKVWPNNPSIVVFAFDFPENGNKKLHENSDEPPVVEEEEQIDENSEFPF